MTHATRLLALLAILLAVAPLTGCDFLMEGASAPDVIVDPASDDDDTTADDDDTTPPVEPPQGNCADGIDNDNDGWTDGADVECLTGTDEIGVSVGECDDHIDNDSDGLIDAQDPVCTVSWFPYESLPTPPGDDDDSTTGICADPMTALFAAFACLPGSLESFECTEDAVTFSCAPPVSTGGDTIIVTVDNSVVNQWIGSFNDNSTTGDDDDSANPEPPPLPYEGDDSGECSDGADNDLDGVFDCNDPGCFGSPDCTDPGDDDDSTGDDDDSTPPGDDDDSAGCPDNDADGFTDFACGGDDCNDWAAGIYPGAQEYCDSVDHDCDGNPYNVDFDGDGYISADCGGDDCLDIPGSISGQAFWLGEWVHPGQVELGDWFDSDCDGTLDNGCVDVCSSGEGGFELDGDPAFECFDSYFVADQSATNSPMDSGLSFTYDSSLLGGSAGTYTGMNVTCEDADPSGTPGNWNAGTGQSDPGNAWAMYDPGTPGIDSIMELIESRN